MSTRLFSGLTASVEQSQFQLMQSIIDTALRDAGDEALARADIIASLPLTRQAVASKDRDKLLAEYAEMFAIQRDRRGVDQAQFHAAGTVAAAAACADPVRRRPHAVPADGRRGQPRARRAQGAGDRRRRAGDLRRCTGP